MQQEITLHVPANFQLPRTFQEGDLEANATALKLGSIAYETILREGQSFTNEKLAESLKKEAEQLYIPQVNSLENRIQKNETLLDSMKSRLQRQSEELHEIEKRIREEERRNREEIVHEKEKQIDELKKQIRELGESNKKIAENYQTSHKSLLEGFQTFKEQILKGTTGSSTKGKMGEVHFSESLSAAFGAVGAGEEFDIECVGTEGHQGDIHMKWKSHMLLWEVKNYTSTVTKKEVEKFLRDMESNPHISIGIMVSLHTGIAGHTHRGGFDIQQLRDGRFCIYITNFREHEDTTLFLQSLQPFLETFMKLRKEKGSVEETTSESVETLERRLGKMEANRNILHRLLEHHINDMNRYKKTVNDSKKKMDAIWTDVLVGVKEAERGIQLLLETLLEDSGDLIDSAESLSSLPPYLFKHEDLTLYNEKEKKFLKDTMELFVFNEDVKTSTKEIKEAYKTRGYSEDAVNAMRPNIFLETAWVKGAKEMRGMSLRVVS